MVVGTIPIIHSSRPTRIIYTTINQYNIWLHCLPDSFGLQRKKGCSAIRTTWIGILSRPILWNETKRNETRKEEDNRQQHVAWAQHGKWKQMNQAKPSQPTSCPLARPKHPHQEILSSLLLPLNGHLAESRCLCDIFSCTSRKAPPEKAEPTRKEAMWTMVRCDVSSLD